MATNVPTVIWGPTGFIEPTEANVLDGVTLDINAAFGGNLNPALTTPQGQLASSMAAVIGNVNDTFLFYSSQTDPAFAVGRMQDAIGRIYFINRNPAQPTTVQCTCVGLQGVVIPAGSLAQDTNGNTYRCAAAGTIPVSGNILLPFENLIPGPIPCPAGSLSAIYQSIPGWDTILNPSDGIIGVDVETRTQFEVRRSAAVAQNSLGSLPSVLGAVLNVAGVTSAYVTENNLNVGQTIGGVLLNPNSIFVCVNGGAAADIAHAIWSRKAPGCAYNGTTVVTVLDTSPIYVPPFPSYSVSFYYAVPLTIVFSIVLAASPAVPSNANQLIQAAIIGAFAGSDGGLPVAVAQPVFASRYYTTVAALGSWAQIVDILVGSVNSAAAVFNGSISSTTLTVSAMVSGNIGFGQSLIDTTGNIPPGVTVVGFITGSGGTGTYSISTPLTVSSEQIFGVTANLFKIQPIITQIPVTAAGNITVTLQ